MFVLNLLVKISSLLPRWPADFSQGYRGATETLAPVGAAINAIIWADLYGLVAAFLRVQGSTQKSLTQRPPTSAENPPSESVTMSKCSHLQ